MSDSSTEYMRLAQDCVRRAERALDPADKARWLQLGEDWLRLALPAGELDERRKPTTADEPESDQQ